MAIAKVEAERSRLERLRQPGTPPVRVKKEIRELMWRYMGVEKNESGMREALVRLEEMRERVLPAMGATHNLGWLDAIDAVNMLDVCVLMTQSALNRKESRGPFIRTDYPEMDNENWLAQNILVPGKGFRVVPYALPYWRPDFERRDNLAVPW